MVFAGIPIIAAYNILPHPAGTGKQQISSDCQGLWQRLSMWGLDLLFVAVFGWGVLGALIATVILRAFQQRIVCSVLQAHSGCASDKRRFSSAAGDESAAYKTGSSAGNTE